MSVLPSSCNTLVFKIAEVHDISRAPKLKRLLKTRHLSMVAIGGAIGTGLFVASGATVAQAGPGSAIIVYALVGIMVYFLMTSLGELTTYTPLSGSFASFGSRYVDEGFGFAIGWNYWYNWAITVAVDLAAAQLVMKYWLPNTPGVLWSVLFLVIIFLLNYISVRGFGEGEFVFSSIKIIVVTLFLITGLSMVVGVLLDSNPSTGWQNLTTAEAPFVGGIPAMLSIAMVAAFSFQGTELIGVAAGESDNPSKSIPQAIRKIFWRILLFYILAIFIISILIPYTDPNLLRNEATDIAISPFTLVLKRAGLASAAAVMNAVVLTSVLSAGNSGMYAATRTLYALATEGKAPRIFAKLSANGIPQNALYATTIVALLCSLTMLFPEKTVYVWLLNLSAMTGIIMWLGIAICHYRFRKGFLLQGHALNTLPYRAKWFPFGSIFALLCCFLIILGQSLQSILSGQINWLSFLGAYVSIPLFLITWLVYRVVRKVHIVSYQAMDFTRPTNR
ncbi:MAG: amino acid permease [Neisseriales bacterium]|nr:MAG: amino acid permease [Neisseriales bacterium]